jgi:hypothetical protein
MEKPETKSYRGFTLHKCWCGYPEMRWMIFYGDKWRATTKTLIGAKKKCDNFIKNFAL